MPLSSTSASSSSTTSARPPPNSLRNSSWKCVRIGANVSVNSRRLSLVDRVDDLLQRLLRGRQVVELHAQRTVAQLPARPVPASESRLTLPSRLELLRSSSISALRLDRRPTGCDRASALRSRADSLDQVDLVVLAQPLHERVAAVAQVAGLQLWAWTCSCCACHAAWADLHLLVQPPQLGAGGRRGGRCSSASRRSACSRRDSTPASAADAAELCPLAGGQPGAGRRRAARRRWSRSWPAAATGRRPTARAARAARSAAPRPGPAPPGRRCTRAGPCTRSCSRARIVRFACSEPCACKPWASCSAASARAWAVRQVAVEPVDLGVEAAQFRPAERDLLVQPVPPLAVLADPLAQVGRLFGQDVDLLLRARGSGPSSSSAALGQVGQVALGVAISLGDASAACRAARAARSCATGCRPRRGGCRPSACRRLRAVRRRA